METKSIVQVAVAVLVAVVVFVTVLIPITNTATAETLEYHNTGSYFAEPDGVEHTIIVDGPNSTISFDGEKMKFPDMPYASISIAYGHDAAGPWVLRMDANGHAGFSGPNNTWTGLGVGVVTAIISDTGNISVSSTSGSSGTRSNVSMFISNVGNYVMSVNPFITDDTELHMAVVARGFGGEIYEIVTGTADNLDTEVCRFLKQEGSSVVLQTFDSATYNIEKSSPSGNLYRVDGINQHVTSTTGFEANVSITQFIVPASITYENPAYTGSTNSTLLGVIPILVIVGLITAVIGIAIARRYDL